MAELYYKVRADYEELIRMQQEASRLKEELSNAATKADFSQITSDLEKVNEKIQALAEKGAKSFVNAFNDLDDGSPEFLKKFDSEFAKFSANMTSTLDGMKSQYESMLDQLTEKSKSVELMNAPRLKEEINSVTEEVKKQIAVIEEQKRVWEGKYDSISTSALDIIKEQREEEEKKLEVLRQQMEVRRQEVEASKPSFADKVGNVMLLGQHPAVQAHNQDVAELEKATQAYEAQERVVNSLKDEEEALKSSLSATAQAQMEEAESSQKSAEERQAYIDKLKETQGEANKTTDVVDELLSRGDAASKDLNLDILKNDLASAEEQLKNLGNELREDIASWKEAQQNLSKMEDEMMNNENSKIDPEEIEEAKAKVEEMRNGVLETADAYDRVDANVKTLKEQINEASGHQISLRTEMRQAREELARMIDAGKYGTPEFMQMAQAAGNLQRQFKLASATMQYFANPTRHLAALKTGLQGVAGAAGLVTGAMGLFNTESKKMQEIQTKVQSVMAIVVGLETTYNALKKTSTLMLAVEEAKTWLLASARKTQAVATEEATVAQEGLNVAMASNPIGAVVAVLATLGAAIYGIVSALSDSEAEMARAQAQTEQMAKSFEYMEKKNQDLAKNTATAIVDERKQFERLQKSYNDAKAAGKDMRLWVEAAKTEHEKLGLAINSVTDAELVYVKKTDLVLEAMALRAKQAALLAVKLEILKDLQRAEMGLPKDPMSASKGYTGRELYNLPTSIRANVFSTQQIEQFSDNLETVYYLSRETVNMINREFANSEKPFYQQKLKEIDYMIDSNASAFKVKVAEIGKDVVVTDKDPVTINNNKKKTTTTTKRGRNNTPNDDKWKEKEDELEREKKDAEDKIKAKSDYENRVTKASIDLMNEGFNKRKRQEEFNAKKEKEDIVKRYREMALSRIATEKAEFDKDEANKHKKDPNNKAHYYESDKYKAHFSGNDPKNGELLLNEDESKGLIAESYLADLKARQAHTKLMEDYLKDQTKFFGKEMTIRRKYDEERSKLREAQIATGMGTPEYDRKLAQINDKESDELNKLKLEDFKGSAMYASVLTDGITDGETIKKFKDKLEELMAVAVNEMSPSDFNAFTDMYKKFSDRLIEINPFGALKQSIEDYKSAQAKLATAKQEREALTELAPDGTIKDADVVLSERHAVVEDARANVNALSEKLQLSDGKSEEEMTEIRESLARATEYLEQEETKYNAVLQSTKAADDKVTNAERQVASARSGMVRAMKSSAKMVNQLTDAFSSLASHVSAPFGQAISDVGNLITATVNGIDTIEMAAESGAHGIEMVGYAVQSAVAILAIIQAVWTAVETIINLVSGSDAEKYQEKIDGLKGKISALDWLFNKLKDDMDNAWGTKAIEAYGRAVETLGEKQKASMDVIASQEGKVDGHHSLSYYFKEKSGLTDAEVAEAKEKIASLGGDVSEGWVNHWLHTLSAEALREFMDSAIGVTVMGKLGGVAGTGDYSGSDWLKDMHDYADSAKSLEELNADMAEKLNGISLEGLRDEWKSLVTTTTTSLNDINNSFDSIMREAIYNKYAENYNEEMEVFYGRLRDLNNDYTKQGGITEEEYRRRLEELRKTWTLRAQQAQDEYQEALTMAGVNATDLEQDATSGGFEALSEDTGTELNGRFASMQAMETVTAESSLQLVGIQTNIANIADEIRTIQVSSLLELQSISENTKKIYDTVGEMQENVRTIKDNTDRL